MELEEARRFALGLPEATEQDHHGMSSFRVRGKIFATVPDPQHIRVFVEEGDVHEAVAEEPAACEELHWGSRLAGVAVTLATVSDALLRELLTDAWRRKAPRSLHYGT
jgi:hypothetical protein